MESLVRRDLRTIRLAASEPSTSKAITNNNGVFQPKTIYLSDNWDYLQQENSRQNNQMDLMENIELFGMGSAERKTGLENNPAEDHGVDKVERKKGISIGPLLENFSSYRVMPTSVPVASYKDDKADHQQEREKFRLTIQHDKSDVTYEDDVDHFKNFSEIQDYFLDDKEWSRESRKFESSNKPGGSSYPALDLVTYSSRQTASSSAVLFSSSASATTMWSEIFEPVLTGSVDRPRVSRSTKQQRAKNLTRSESAREQRRKCRYKGCRGRNWCPDMDIGNRAFLAPTVFEGKARSMSSLRKPGSNYAVTFEVKQVYKSQPGFQPLQKNDSVRLHFRDKSTPGKSTLCSNVASRNPGQQQQKQQQQRDNTSEVVRANIKRGKVYLVFVNRVGPRNFTILGEPVMRSKKNELAVQAVDRPDYGKSK